MGLGIPSVASPVGINAEVIQDGSNGFLASNEEQWLEKLSRLIDSAELRRQLGAAGRQTIEQKYSAAVWAPKILHIIHGSNGARSSKAHDSQSVKDRRSDDSRSAATH